MSNNQVITVYGDFNCPFCYALNERLPVYAQDYRRHWMAADRALNHAKQSGRNCIRAA